MMRYDEWQRLGVRKHKILSSLLPPLLFLLMAPITQTSPVPDLVCLSTFSGNFNQLCGEERIPVLEHFWPRNTRYISKKSNLENLIKDGWRCPDPGTTRGAKSRHGQTEAACALLFHQTKTIEDIPLIQYIREGVKKNIFFGTLSQTSDSTHPPRAFGTPLSER